MRYWWLGVAVWAGVLLALVGGFLTPYRLFGVLVPVSLVIVIAGNWLLVRLTYEATGGLGLSLLPPLVWLGVTLAMARRTTEGDLVLAGNNWVANVYIIVGCIAAALPAYRLINPRPRPPAATPPA
jgi:hypothetical protein